MARTPLASQVEQIAGKQVATRRQILATGALTGAAMALPRWTARARGATAPRIAIVGGGLAGLTAAFTLKNQGYAATVYEASSRLGGRCWTRRGDFDYGQIAEHGGEVIDTGHIEIRQLCQCLGLTLDNLHQAEPQGTDMLGWIDGAPYTAAQIQNDLSAIWQQVHSDYIAAGTMKYNNTTARGLQLDQMSINDYVAAYVPGGRSSRLGQLLETAYSIENGLDSGSQPALNMVYFLGWLGQGQLRLFGASNEKYHVRGGNDLIVSSLAQSVGSASIQLGKVLSAVKENTDGTYKLSFADGTAVTGDHVVLALPFSVMRGSVDLAQAGFKATKLSSINELGMGQNTKMHVQFTSRNPWYAQGCNGETITDLHLMNTWEVSRAQAGAGGILVDFKGGTGALNAFGSGTPASYANAFLTEAEQVFPGLTAAWNGRVTIDDWPKNPWTKGSYSCPKIGQYTKFFGVEPEMEGRLNRCHFAGEHTSYNYEGYLQGAVESGQRAAAEILAAV